MTGLAPWLLGIFLIIYFTFLNETKWSVVAKLDPNTPEIKAMNLTSIGCFKDKGGTIRPFPFVKHQTNYFIYNDWNNLTEQIKRCKDLVKSKDYKYFGFQFYGECWYGPPLRVNYAKDGKSTDCLNGAGAEGSLMVYKIN